LSRSPKKYGKIDLILASPECTNYSPAKGNKPRCEQSKDTAFQVVRFAKAFKPRWVVIENVVNMRKWTRYAEFKTALETLGYKLQEQVLNSAHFGVAQSRRRLFLTADLKQQPPKNIPRKPVCSYEERARSGSSSGGAQSSASSLKWPDGDFSFSDLKCEFNGREVK
jgi:site-specific DNA-cytosine methylase